MKTATVNNTIRSGQRTIQDWKASSGALSEAFDDGRATLERLVDQTKDRVEDMLYQATRRIKRNPLGIVAMAFGAGAVIGALIFARGGRR